MKYLKMLLTSINRSDKTEENRLKLFNQISEFIQLHSFNRQFSRSAHNAVDSFILIFSFSLRIFVTFSDIFQPATVTATTISIGTVCGSLLMLLNELV